MLIARISLLPAGHVGRQEQNISTLVIGNVSGLQPISNYHVWYGKDQPDPFRVLDPTGNGRRIRDAEVHAHARTDGAELLVARSVTALAREGVLRTYG